MDIPPIVNRSIRAAQGWLQLKAPHEALEEFESLPPEFRSLPEVFECKIAIHIHESRWDTAYSIATYLMEHFPSRIHNYIHAAYCLHEMKRTSDARTTLLEAPDPLHETAIFYYNMACYEAQLGNKKRSLLLLNECFRRDPSYKNTAQSDPDLTPLHIKD